MSSVYISEPNTKGKVILQTSVGPLDIELWPKESPKAVRNFVQLCLEGYYDNTIFHRLVKDFIIQGGDPTGSGTGGESIYGEPFADEFHQRLRFSHRGIVAMANLGPPHSNTSQFFITLAATPELQNKHTIFGKIMGDTFFNIFKVNGVEVDENERPAYPPKIISVDVVWNPFEDIIPRENKIVQVEQPKIESKKSVPLKKESRLLSIGEEVDEEEKVYEEIKGVKAYIGKNKKKMSSEDFITETAHTETDFQNKIKNENSNEKQEKVSNKTSSVHNNVTKGELSIKKEENEEEEQEESEGEGEDYNFDQKMRDKILSKKKQYEHSETKIKQEQKPDPKPKMLPKPKLKGTLVFKKEGDQTTKKRKGNDKSVLAKLDSFKKTLQSTNPSGENENENAGEDESAGWNSHSLQFPKEKISKYLETVDDYVVKDPLNGDHKKLGSYHERRLGPKKMGKW